MDFEDLVDQYSFHRSTASQATAYSAKIHEYALESNNEHYIARSYYYIAESAYYNNDLALSKEYCSKCLTSFANTDSCTEIPACYNLLGVIYSNKGNELVALDNYINGINYSEQHNITNMISSFYNNIACIYLSIMDYENAIVYIKKGLAYEQELNSTRYSRLFMFHINLCESYYHLDRYDDLVSSYEMAVKYSQLSDYQYYKPYLVLIKSFIVKYSNDLDATIKSYKDIISILDKDLFNIDSLRFLLSTVENVIKDKEYDYAKKILSFAEKLLNEYSLDDFLLTLYENQMALYESLGDLDKVKEIALMYVTQSKKRNKIVAKITSDSMNERFRLDQAKKEQRIAEKRAITDSLTDIYNRHALTSIFEDIFQNAKKKSHHVAAIIMDIDFFKQYNDTYGHLAGDKCIKDIAAILKDLQSDTFLPLRYGGDEFFLLALDYTDESLHNLLKDIDQKVKKLSLIHPATASGYVTLTTGVCNVIPAADDTIYDLLRHADVALYKGKSHRGSICFSSDRT